MQALHDDILQLIFLCSSYKEILVLSQVNTKFYALGEQPLLWKAKLLERIGRVTKRDPKQFFRTCLRAGQGCIMDMLQFSPIHDPLLTRRDIHRLDASIVEGHHWIVCVTASQHCRVSYNGKQGCIGRAEDTLIYACGESAFVAVLYKSTIQVIQLNEEIVPTKIWYKRDATNCKLIGMTVFIQEHCLKLVYMCNTRVVTGTIGPESKVVYMEGQDVYLDKDRNGCPTLQQRGTDTALVRTTNGNTVRHHRDSTLRSENPSKILDTRVLWMRDTYTTMDLCYVRDV